MAAAAAPLDSTLDPSTASTPQVMSDPNGSTTASESAAAAASASKNGTPLSVPKNWRTIEEEEISGAWSPDIKMATTSYAQALNGTYNLTGVKPLYNNEENDFLYILQGVSPDAKTNKPVPGIFVFNSLTGNTKRFLAPMELADIVKNLDTQDGKLNWDGLKMSDLEEVARAA